MFNVSLARAFAALLLAASVRSVAAAGLLDAPIVGDALQLLDGNLGGAWSVTNNGSISVPAGVPGDLLTDLELAGIIGDPLYERNFKTWAWDATDFTFTKTFDAAPAVLATAARWLIYDSVKMGAYVSLNGVFLGAVHDQFLRYAYDVSATLQPSGNVLRVTFPPSNNSLNDEARWIACSGAWDWAPYTSTYSGKGSHTMSKGIVRSVYLLGVGAAAIEHVQPRVFYRGAYPTAPLTDATAGPWDVVVRVHFSAPGAAGASGTLAVQGAWGGVARAPVTLPPGNSTAELTLAVPAGGVALWWPNELGAQALYNLTATFTPDAGGPVLSATRRVGFRFFALVTANDTDPSTLAGVDGSGSFTMRFNVNGAKIFARGSNLIPMDEMEGRLSADAHVFMLRSAADAHFNTLRVWGGGSYYPDVVYDTADELGLLLYHDAMYGQPWFGGNSGVPIANAMQDAEIRHQLRRLSHHPSIALWDACNECGGGGVWGSFVSPTLADEDPSRPVWPACPSTGWKSGVDRLTGLPNGRPLVLQAGSGTVATRAAGHAAPPRPRAPAAARPASAATCQTVHDVDYGKGQIWIDAPASDLQGCCDACTAQAGCLAGVLYMGTCYLKNASMVALPSWSTGIDAVWVAGETPVVPPAGGCNTGLSLETHGYYQHGEGFATVNSGASLQPFDPNVPPALDPPFALGPNACPGTFASEFGASAWSSFESVSPTLAQSDWNAHAAPMYERNYALDNFLTAYFAVTWPAGVVALSLKAQLYLALVAQALLVKSDISTRRSRNSFGVCTWQLNEIWPTGGWGGLEYGTVGFTPGQVIGGRWKPIHHFYAQHLYTSLFASCSDDARCIVRNDDPLSGFSGALVLTALNVSNSARVPLSRTPVALGPGAGAAAWSCAAAAGGGGACAGWAAALAPLGLAPTSTVLLISVESPAGAVAYASFELLATPAAYGDALSPAVAVTAAVGAPAPDGRSAPVVVTVAGGGGGAAALVVLTTAAQGRFSENAMVLPSGQHTVHFIAFGALDVAALQATLRVEHARSYRGEERAARLAAAAALAAGGPPPAPPERELTPLEQATLDRTLLVFGLAVANGYEEDAGVCVGLCRQAWREGFLLTSVMHEAGKRARKAATAWAAAAPALAAARAARAAARVAARAGARVTPEQRAAAKKEDDAEEHACPHQRTRLHFAARRGRAKRVCVLLASGAAVNARNGRGATPLTLASSRGRRAVVAALLAAPGVAINAVTTNGFTPLHIAAQNGRAEVVSALLVAPGVAINADERRPHAAVGHAGVVAALLAAPGVTVMARSTDGSTALHTASAGGHAAVVAALVALPGVDANAALHNGRTSLFIASQNGHAAAVSALLAVPGVAVNEADTNGATPLHAASVCGHVAVVAALLASPGVAVNAATADGITPLLLASDSGYAEVVTALIAAPGVAVNVALPGGPTPLFMASQKGHAAVVSALLACMQYLNSLLAVSSVDVNAVTVDGWTPLYAASLHDHADVVAALVAALGVSVNAADNDDRTPLYVASERGYAAVVAALLISPDVDVNAADVVGATPLFRSSMGGHAGVVIALLAAPGVSVNAADDDGWAPLHGASYNGHAAVVSALLAHSTVNVNARTTVAAGGVHAGATARRIARNRGHLGVAALLEARGGTLELAVACGAGRAGVCGQGGAGRVGVCAAAHGVCS